MKTLLIVKIKKTAYNFLILILCVLIHNCDEHQKKSSVLGTTKTTYTYVTVNNKDLFLDCYRPKNNNKKLPLIVYLHGGGFANGKRDDEKIVDFAQQLSHHNYATISISYRLTRANLKFDCNTSAVDKLEAFNEASKDISQAINFILEHQDTLNIDTKKIIIAGTSAGAEAILNLVYTDQRVLLPKDFMFAGIISRAGAVKTLKYINKNTALPIQLFHGDKDGSVPYNIGSHHHCKNNQDGYLKLFGSRAISNHLKKLNKPYHLVTQKGGDHGMNGLDKDIFINEALVFLNSVITNSANKQIENFY